MAEESLSKKLVKVLSALLPDYKVSKNENILYRIYIDENGEIKPKETKEPKRGQSAFQSDLLISDKVPLVAIEIKFDSLSTHDILTYSTKAVKHKEIYPYLRYGLVVGNKERISRKFFTHNTGFDFAFALTNISDDIGTLTEVIVKQIESAKSLIRIMSDNTVKTYESILTIKHNE